MINVSEVLLDPDFAQIVTVERSQGSFVLGGWSETPTLLQLSVVVDVASAQDLEQVPEGDRVRGAMAFYSTQPLYGSRGGATSSANATADVVRWNGQRYRIASVTPYVSYGYWVGIGVRMSGE